MFKKIQLTIHAPDKAKEVRAEVNEILTVTQIINELIRNEFVPAEYNYGLLIEGDGRIFSQNSTLVGIDNNTDVRVVAFSEKRIVNGDKINVTFLHPTDGTDMEVELNDGLTVSDVINELVACSFIEDADNLDSYRLFIKNSQTEIEGDQTLASGGTIDGSVLRVVVE